MNVLGIGGTGTVGSAVARALFAREVSVHVLTRRAANAARLPAEIRPVVGDLLDPATVRSAFRDRDAVFMANPVSATETHEGLMAVNGARMGGVRRFVYLSVQGAEGAPHLPHFGSKIAVEAALRASGLAWTILRPNNFFQNDYWYRDALVEHGVYPQPLGHRGASRVDVRDIADAAVSALATPGHEGRTYTLAGPEPVTGPDVAEAWGRALGRPVVYVGDDLDAFEQQAGRDLPPWMAFDLRLMFEHFGQHGLRATPDELAAQAALTGRPPRRFADFARETAATWHGAGAS